MSRRPPDPWLELARANRGRTDARLAVVRVLIVVAFVVLWVAVLAAGFAS